LNICSLNPRKSPAKNLDKTLAGNPAALKKVPQAIKELIPVFKDNASMTLAMRDWFERGGMQTLLQVLLIA
jgi:hypothetical protein